MTPELENDSDAMAPTISAAAKLARDTNAAIVLVHHKGDSEKFYRGSTAIRDQCDALFALLRDSEDDDDGIRRLSCGRGKGMMRYAPEPSDVFLEIAPEHGGVVAAQPPESSVRGTASTPDTVKAGIVECLPGRTKTEVATQLRRTLDDSTFKSAWAELEQAGDIVRIDAEWQVVVTPSPSQLMTTTTCSMPESGGSVTS